MSKTILEELLRKIALAELECLFSTLEIHFNIERGLGVSLKKIQELKYDIEQLAKLKEELP